MKVRKQKAEGRSWWGEAFLPSAFCLLISKEVRNA